jgi:hypothetical protein
MSNDLVNPFAELLEEPTFVLTSDQDWAPDWALSSMLEIVATHDVPLHLFITNESEVLHSRRPANLTFGIHPNFLAGSTHGASTDEVIDFCLAIVPGADTFRSHSISENSCILLNLASRGFVADSNLVTFLQPALAPLIHNAGLLRFPVFFEDDVFLRWAGPDLSFGSLASLLLTPGLKVLNYHPALVGINAPSVDYYDARRSMLFGPSKTRTQIDPYGGPGAATLLVDLIDTVRGAGFDFLSFPQLVTKARACLSQVFPDGLYRWPLNPAPGQPGRAIASVPNDTSIPCR